MEMETDDPLDILIKEERGENESVRSRSSSFMKSGFATLVHTDKEEEELEKFFNSQKHFMILTNAGKPIFSLYYFLSSYFLVLEMSTIFPLSLPLYMPLYPRCKPTIWRENNFLRKSHLMTIQSLMYQNPLSLQLSSPSLSLQTSSLIMSIRKYLSC